MSPAQSTGTWSANPGIIASSRSAKASLVLARWIFAKPLAVKPNAATAGEFTRLVNSLSSSARWAPARYLPS